MLNIMDKSTSLSAPKADIRSSFQIWAAAHNQLFSSVLDQPVTNRQMLLLVHCLTAFSALILFCGSLIGAIITFFWFVGSLYLAKKGGLR